jgi:hypothetical protein
MLKLINANIRIILTPLKYGLRPYSVSSINKESETHRQTEEQPSSSYPSRPKDWTNIKLTNVVESKDDFVKYVQPLIPETTVPDPPEHKSYPTPSGWIPPDLKKSSKLPYYVLRTRFHQFPIYPILRNGLVPLVRVRNIEGDIWVK